MNVPRHNGRRWQRTGRIPGSDAFRSFGVNVFLGSKDFHIREFSRDHMDPVVHHLVSGSCEADHPIVVEVDAKFVVIFRGGTKCG